MSHGGEALSSLRLRALLDELSKELASRDMVAQMFVVGGAAMALAYDEVRATRDVDAVFEPLTQMREIAAEIGDRHGLDEDWLNDAAKLANIAGLTTIDQGVDLLGRKYPASMLLPRHRYIVDDVMARAAAMRESTRDSS